MRIQTLKIAVAMCFLISFPDTAVEANSNNIKVTCDENTSANLKITKAIERASQIRAANSNADVTIKFSPGVCRLDEPVILDQKNSGSFLHPIVFEGASNGETIITGAFKMMALRKDFLPADLPLSSKKIATPYQLSKRARVAFAAERPRGAYYPSTTAAIILLQNDHWLTLGRWPKESYIQTNAVPRMNGPIVWPTFYVPKDKIGSWSREKDLWLGGYWAQDFAYETLKVASIDKTRGLVKTKGPLSTEYDEAPSLNYFVFNATSELTAPGEYTVDSKAGIATIVKYAGAEPESVETQNLIELHNAHDIQFRHIQLRGALDTIFSAKDSSRITIEDCLISISGRTGIRIDQGFGNIIARTVITKIGETAVVLKGGNRTTLTPAKDILRDSIVTNYGLLTRTYRPALLIDGVGMQVKGSLFENGPFDAIMIKGNNNVVQRNEFFHVVREAGDAGAIYLGRNLSWRGNVIEENYFHDIRSDILAGRTPRGVYLDDFVSGNRVKKNIFYHVTYPVFIHGGSDNSVTHNLFVCSEKDSIFIHNDPKAWKHQGFNVSINEEIRKMGIPTSSMQLYRKEYPGIDRSITARGYEPRNNNTSGNIVAGDGNFGSLGKLFKPFAAIKHIGAIPCDVPTQDKVKIAAKKEMLFFADQQSALSDLPYYSFKNESR